MELQLPRPFLRLDAVVTAPVPPPPSSIPGFTYSEPCAAGTGLGIEKTGRDGGRERNLHAVVDRDLVPGVLDDLNLGAEDLLEHLRGHDLVWRARGDELAVRERDDAVGVG